MYYTVLKINRLYIISFNNEDKHAKIRQFNLKTGFLMNIFSILKSNILKSHYMVGHKTVKSFENTPERKPEITYTHTYKHKQAEHAIGVRRGNLYRDIVMFYFLTSVKVKCIFKFKSQHI